MAYSIIKFGDVTLPNINVKEDISPVPAMDTNIETLAGVFEVTDELLFDYPYNLVYKASVGVGTVATKRDYIDTLRALTGKVKQLWRDADDDDTEIHFAYAKLLKVTQEKDVYNPDLYELSFNFRVLTRWNGDDHEDWRFDDGSLFDDTLDFDTNDFTFSLTTTTELDTVVNGGNLTVQDAVITVTAGSVGLNGIRVRKLGETDLVWTGTVSANTSIVFDCGALTVMNNGVNAYSGFSLGANHAIDGWLKLDPGGNNIFAYRTGGDANVTINYNFYDGWY